MEEIKLEANTWVIYGIGYVTGILKWNTDELKSLDRRTRTFMAMHGVPHPKSDVDKVYLSKKMQGRGLKVVGYV